MQVRIKHLQGPVELTEPTVPQPSPVAGCDVCGALATQRTEATRNGDRSKVSDCNVEIQRHTPYHLADQ